MTDERVTDSDAWSHCPRCGREYGVVGVTECANGCPPPATPPGEGGGTGPEEYGAPGDGRIEPGVDESLMGKLRVIAAGGASGQVLWREEAQALVATLDAPRAAPLGEPLDREAVVALDRLRAGAELHGIHYEDCGNPEAHWACGCKAVEDLMAVLPALAPLLPAPGAAGGREALRARLAAAFAENGFVDEEEPSEGTRLQDDLATIALTVLDPPAAALPAPQEGER